MSKKSLAEKISDKLEAILDMLSKEGKAIVFDKVSGTGYIVPAGSYVDASGDEPDNPVDLNDCETVELPGEMFYANADFIGCEE